MSKPMYRLDDGKGTCLDSKIYEGSGKAGVWGYCLSGRRVEKLQSGR